MDSVREKEGYKREESLQYGYVSNLLDFILIVYGYVII